MWRIRSSRRHCTQIALCTTYVGTFKVIHFSIYGWVWFTLIKFSSPPSRQASRIRKVTMTYHEYASQVGSIPAGRWVVGWFSVIYGCTGSSQQTKNKLIEVLTPIQSLHFIPYNQSLNVPITDWIPFPNKYTQVERLKIVNFASCP